MRLIRMLMRVFMCVFVLVIVRVNCAIRMSVLVRMLWGMFVRMRRLGMAVAVAVCVLCFVVRMIMYGGIVLDHYIDLGAGQPAAAYLAHFQVSADVERNCCLFKQGKRYARIHKRAKQHVAADAGEALQISDSHGNEIVPTRRAATAHQPAALRSRTRNENLCNRASRTGSLPFATPRRSCPSCRV